MNACYTGSSGWTKQAFLFDAPKGLDATTPCHVIVELRNAKGAVWFDDVRVSEFGF